MPRGRSVITTLCRHCDTRKASQARRGLCQRCGMDPDIRKLYPYESKYRPPDTDMDRFMGGREPPAEPTAALPGTAEKMAVMEQRALERVELFHPDDARAMEDDGEVETPC